MFKEWKAIFKKPTFIIVMIGVALIPALYNVIFLSHMEDIPHIIQIQKNLKMI